MKVIGLTGGIGCGKTTVLKIFEKFGCLVYNSDLRAKTIQNSCKKAIESIKQFFGEDIYQEGILQRKKLADIVFKQPEKLKQLEKIVHPLVFEDFEKFCQDNKTKEFIILESAVLIESGFYKYTDFLVLVTALQEKCIERVIKRDNISRVQVLERMSKQMNDFQRKEFCKYIIENNEMQTLDNQVLQILNKER